MTDVARLGGFSGQQQHSQLALDVTSERCFMDINAVCIYPECMQYISSTLRYVIKKHPLRRLLGSLRGLSHQHPSTPRRSAVR